MVATFHLHYLGYMIKYGSLGVGNTAQQLLSILSISDSMNLIQLRIYLNIIFWILLWMLTSLFIWNLKYCEYYPEILLQVSKP